MKLLLDTHTFIWWDSEPSKLPQNAISLIEDRSNEVMLSVTSVWEMQIKGQLGKLILSRALAQIIEDHQKINDIKVLPIMLSHVLELENLPLHHNDPFDRLLIAQANIEGAALVSHDQVFTQYPVDLVW
jgi:PIN domain nuclease of toxin-antitoxin system